MCGREEEGWGDGGDEGGHGGEGEGEKSGGVGRWREKKCMEGRRVRKVEGKGRGEWGGRRKRWVRGVEREVQWEEAERRRSK